MTVWDGKGLPPAAQARIDRARQDHVTTSLLSVSGQVGLDVCGFRPVGEVMGCIVEHIGFQGYGGCGYFPYAGMMGNSVFGMGSVQSAQSFGVVGFAPYVDALYAGWDGAIGRMLIEARSLGADGVVDVRLQQQSMGQDTFEFVALGTAVASIGARHVERPFSTTLTGSDFTKLFTSGWMPTSIIVGISVGIRHDDYQTRTATSTFSGNMEVPGYTELANHTRHGARSTFAHRAQQAGGDGAIVSWPMTLAMWGLEVGEGHRDHVAARHALRHLHRTVF